MKDEKKFHHGAVEGAVDEPSSEQRFCKSNAISYLCCMKNLLWQAGQQ